MHSAACYWVGFLARGMCDRSARRTKFALEFLLLNVTGEMRSPWTLPVVVKKFSSIVLHVIGVGQQTVFSLSIQTLTLLCTR